MTEVVNQAELDKQIAAWRSSQWLMEKPQDFETWSRAVANPSQQLHGIEAESMRAW